NRKEAQILCRTSALSTPFATRASFSRLTVSVINDIAAPSMSSTVFASLCSISKAISLQLRPTVEWTEATIEYTQRPRNKAGYEIHRLGPRRRLLLHGQCCQRSM